MVLLTSICITSPTSLGAINDGILPQIVVLVKSPLLQGRFYINARISYDQSKMCSQFSVPYETAIQCVNLTRGLPQVQR
jgi:hypothetical protein